MVREGWSKIHNGPKLISFELYIKFYRKCFTFHLQITSQNCQKIIDLMNKSIEFTTGRPEYGRGRRRDKGLQKMLEFMKVVYSSSSESPRDESEQYYRVHIKRDSDSETVDSKIINFWCFSPAFG